jgi:hypothetical protein
VEGQPPGIPPVLRHLRPIGQHQRVHRETPACPLLSPNGTTAEAANGPAQRLPLQVHSGRDAPLADDVHAYQQWPVGASLLLLLSIAVIVLLTAVGLVNQLGLHIPEGQADLLALLLLPSTLSLLLLLLANIIIVGRLSPIRFIIIIIIFFFILHRPSAKQVKHTDLRCIIIGFCCSLWTIHPLNLLWKALRLHKAGQFHIVCASTFTARLWRLRTSNRWWRQHRWR